MACRDGGANIATAQTEPLRGPGGVSAMLQVSSADDHESNTHLCSAEYRLVLTAAHGGAPVVIDLLTSPSDWGRSLSLHLDGFSEMANKF